MTFRLMFAAENKISQRVWVWAFVRCQHGGILILDEADISILHVVCAVLLWGRRGRKWGVMESTWRVECDRILMSN